MKIALIGYGKMGKEIEQVILDQKRDEVVLKISEDNIGEFTTENLRRADVAIEFTAPHSALDNIRKCLDAGVPVVAGTTAWYAQLDEVRKLCAEKKGAVFYSPNFSIGVNIFFEVNRRLAQLMNAQPQYAVSMEEIHHTEKKDAPSGTAIKTAEVILEELKRVKQWKLVEEANGTSNALPIMAKRETGVPGTHIVRFESPVDFIELKHEAKSRRGFAEGAVVAAQWLVGKEGVFEMKDLLK